MYDKKEMDCEQGDESQQHQAMYCLANNFHGSNNNNNQFGTSGGDKDTVAAATIKDSVHSVMPFMEIQHHLQGHQLETDCVEVRTLWDTKVRIPVPVSPRNKRHIIVRLQHACKAFVRRRSSAIRITVLTFCALSYLAYLICAVLYSLELATPLIIMTGIVCALMLYTVIRDEHGESIYKTVIGPAKTWIDERWHWIKWICYCTVACTITSYMVLSVISTWRQLQSLAGMVLFIFLPWITCKHPSKIRWRPVIWGLALQFIIGILVLRWQPGYDSVNWLSKKINTIMFYSLEGAGPAFGDPWFFLHPFLMLVIPLVVFVGVVTTVFFHFGWIQWFAAKFGWLMDNTLGTTAIESVSIAVNIFLSVMDTVLMLKPYVRKLTKSEFHCFLVGAHSTIAGFAFGLFVMFGVKPQHLLTGSVMSAPAAVAIAKLNWPETEKSVFSGETEFHMDKGQDPNVFVALARGAWEAGKAAVTILIQVLAFFALLAWMDDTVYWLGAKVGLEISLSGLTSYLFMPLAYVIGVDTEDVYEVGNIMGIKIIANEFLAYLRLGQLGREQVISDRSQAIATYAMCGFSSFGTMLIMTGVWSSVDASKTKEIVRLIPRILMNSNLACFLTASIAGIFYNDGIVEDKTETPLLVNVLMGILQALPSYSDLMALVGM